MSTTFKIIQNHISSSRGDSPRKSNFLAVSQHLSPSSKAKFSDDDSQSLDKDQLLKLEIKQLQRQNKFLKKKITELTAELNGEHRQVKKKTVAGKGASKQDQDPNHLTIDFFYQQINNLLNSVAGLYKIQFTTEELKQYSTKFNKQELKDPNRRYVYYKKATLSRKLQKISLQSEQKRYASLLDIFIEYYNAKQQCDKYIRQLIDDLSQKTLQLNKMIVENASKKRNSMKGSTVKSQYCFDDMAQKSHLVFPWSTKAMSPPTVINFRDKIYEQGHMKTQPNKQ